LAPREAEALVRTLEDAAQVHRRHQFFVWTQSQFQTLLPHSILCCGTYHRQRRSLVFDQFHNVVVSPPARAPLVDADGTLLRRGIAQWAAGGGKPLLVDAAPALDGGADDLRRLRDELSDPQLLLHGVARPHQLTEIESLFLFVVDRRRPARILLPRLELLMPHIHIIWRHVQTVEHSLLSRPSALEPPASPAARQVVTHRERQILQWIRDGKSNLEIGEVLSISPLTVKNHVQKILRKLNAANRAQAVAQAMALNLLQMDDVSIAAR
jgi:transcriptional regulator EpsA